MWEVLKSAKHVVDQNRQVRIDREALVQVARKLVQDEVEVPPWNRRYHFCGETEDVVSYLLVLDSINFCFWPESGRAQWEIKYESSTLSGYYALAASLKNAVESGVPITRAEYLAELSLDKLKEILGGKGELQLLEDRLRILNELGQVVIGEYNGKAGNLVDASQKSAIKLTRLLAQKLPSFRDIARYSGFEVFFYKRAQIFAADLYGALGDKGYGSFIDMNKLTCFADYKLPQVLRHLGILRYAPSLTKKINRKIVLDAGSPEEVEIRASTVWAVELMRQELEQMGKGLRAFELDWVLWNMGQHTRFKKKPYHRTLTIFY